MRNIWMKKATFSGIKWILCDLLLAVLLLGLPGCARETAEISTQSEPVAAAAETEPSDTEEIVEPVISAPEATVEEDLPALSSVEISFDYERMSTLASNQLAVWVEDADGNLVKTILVTDFSAARRGYRSRDTTLSHWVGAAVPDSMSDEQLDAVSSATPSAGRLTYSWDLTDQNGNRVPDGSYTVYLEGTLFWESDVLFSSVIDTGTAEPGTLPVGMLRSEPDNGENENMLRNVQISAIA